MISVIICSVDSERFSKVSENISQTIGVEHEILFKDNKGSSEGICKVYNSIAKKAQYPVLCFVHEDVRFDSQGWGRDLGAKALEKGSGVIGFAGSAAKSRTASTFVHKNHLCMNFSSLNKDLKGETKHSLRCTKGEFCSVITIDGMFLMVSREAYDAVGGFDEHTFRGFHLYDLDLCTAVHHAGYTNYVSGIHEFVHFSHGGWSKTWWSETQKYQQKWQANLPLYIESQSEQQISKDETYIHFAITYHLMKHQAANKAQIKDRVMWQLKKHPFKFKSFYHLYRYLRMSEKN